MAQSPLGFARRITYELGFFLAFPAGAAEIDVYPGRFLDNDICAATHLCSQILPLRERRLDERARVVDIGKLVRELNVRTTQIHLTLLSLVPFLGYDFEDAAIDVSAPWVTKNRHTWHAMGSPIAVAWLAVLTFLLISSRGATLALVLACIVVVHYTVLTVVVGHVFIDRYGMVLSPFYAVLSATAFVTMLRLIIRGVHKTRMDMQP